MNRICGMLIVAGAMIVSAGCGDSGKSADPRPADPSKAPQLKQLTEGAGSGPKVASPPKDQGVSKTP